MFFNPIRMVPENFFKMLLVCLFIYAGTASAQIGFETSLTSPNGDIGQFYKKNISADLYAIDGCLDGRVRIRMGLFYTKLSPRLDTVPIYGVQIGGTPNVRVVPGILVDGKLSMEYFYGDISYRIIKIKKLALFAGIGIEGGKVHESYYRVLETVINDNTNSDVLVAGYKANSSIEYNINPHFDVYFQANYIHLVATDHSTNFTHTTMGVGTNIYLATRKKSKHKHMLTND